MRIVATVCVASGIVGCGASGIEPGMPKDVPAAVVAPPAAEKPAKYTASRPSAGPAAAEKPAHYVR